MDNVTGKQTWMGDKDIAAFLTDSGHIMIDRRRDGVDYTIMDNDYLLQEEGFLPQPLADIDSLAEEIAKARGIRILGREPFDNVIIHYICDNQM